MDLLYENLSQVTANATANTLQNVTTFEWMFHNCTNLTSVDTRNWNTANINNFRSMFG